MEIKAVGYYHSLLGGKGSLYVSLNCKIFKIVLGHLPYLLISFLGAFLGRFPFVMVLCVIPSPGTYVIVPPPQPQKVLIP